MPLPEDGTPSGESIYDGPPQFNPYEPQIDEEGTQPYSPPEGAISAPGGEAPRAETEEQKSEILPEFDERYREPFTGLLYLGRLEKTFRFAGHTFVVRTLTTEQLAEIGLLVKPYIGTPAESGVYQSAVVAACVVSVDGKPLPEGITRDATGDLGAVRFPYVMKNWMPPVREHVYNECFRLELTVRKVLEQMGESSG